MNLLTRPIVRTLAFAAAMAAAIPALARGVDDFKLSRAMPSDVFMAVHSRSHEGQEFLNKQMERVWKALEDAHLERDIKKMFRAMAEEGGETPESFDEKWQKFSDLAAGVQWAALAEQEFAFGMRLDAGGPVPMPQWVMLMVPKEGTAQENFDGLARMLETLTGLAPPGELALSKDETGDTVIHKVGFANVPVPMGVALARHKDTLVISFGTTMVDQVLGMLDGKGGEPLAATDRFKQAFSGLPEGKDGLMFIDMVRLMSQLRTITSNIMNQAMGPEADPKLQALPGKIFDAIDVWEYVAAVGTTQDKRTTETSLTMLRENAKSTPVYKMFYSNGALEEPLKFIPKEAGDMSVTSGVDFSAMYREITQFIRENVPDGEANVQQFEDMCRAELGLDIQKDILAWIKGEIRYFTIPGKTPYSPGETVVLISVHDADKAREMVGRMLDAIEPELVKQNGSIGDAEVEGAEGFKSVKHPMLGMMPIGTPTIGVAKDQLIISTSPRAIAKALAVAEGAESFAGNERFQKEGVNAGSNVAALSFSDLTGFGEQIGGLLQMVPMIAMMAPQDAMPPQAQAIFSMLSRLGPVVQQIDFLLSTSSVTTFDGKQVLTKTVTNYRESPKAQAAESSGGEQ